MPPLPESEFRSLLADCSQSAVAKFVADLWRARGREVRREGNRLLVDGRELRPVVDFHAVGSAAGDETLVTATSTGTDADDSVVGPADLYHALLYDVPRERAAELFEAHFDRPLEVERSAESSTDPTPDTTRDTVSSVGGAVTGETPETADGPGSSVETDGSADETAAASPESTAGSTDESATDPTEATGESATEGDRSGRRLADRFPGSRPDLRSLATDPRAQIVVVLAVALVAASLWGLFVYEPEPEPVDAPFAVENPPAPADGSYRVVAQTHTTRDGEQIYSGFTWTYAPGDPPVATRRLSGSGGDEWATYVNYKEGDVSYARHTWSNESRYRERVDDWPADRTSDSMRSIYRINQVSRNVSSVPNIGFPTWRLAILPYERTGTTTFQGREVVRYVPTTGWTEREAGPQSEPQTYRIRSATGEVLVDPDTGALVYGDVEATFVEAETWADVLTEEDVDVSVEYRVETDVDRPEAPPWVEGLEAAGNETVV